MKNLSSMTDSQRRALAIARRDGVVIAGKSAHAGRVEYVAASTIAALVARGYLTQSHGSDGNCAGRPVEAA